MEEDIKVLEKVIHLFKSNDTKCLSGLDIRAIENLIKGYRELDKDNNDLRRLYRKTAVKLKENGKEDLGDYFLAQINEVPTFVIDDIDYYAEYHKLKSKVKEKIEPVINELEKNDFVGYADELRDALYELMEDK